MPLKGVTVLDLTRLLPGAFCTMMLADFGAEVIRIEDPSRGDGQGGRRPHFAHELPFFVALNRNKKALALNLKADKGREIFLRLAEKADVVVEAFRPGTAQRLGIPYDVVRKVNSRIVYCSISGYGQTGPYRDKVGHDLNYIGLTGVLAMTGTRDGRPAIPIVQIGDIAGGGLMATCAILSALHHVARGGEGQHLDVSIFDGLISVMNVHIVRSQIENETPGPGDSFLTGRFLCYDVYRTKDGEHVTLAALEPKFWKSFCETVRRPEWIPYQYATGPIGDRIRGELEEMFLSRTRDEWARVFESTDSCVEPVQKLEELFCDPHAVHREMILDTEHPEEGRIRQVAIPVKFSATPCAIRGHSPSFGEHTEEVLRRIGLCDREIAELVVQKVVARAIDNQGVEQSEH